MVEMIGGRKRGNLYHVRIDLGVPDGELLVELEPTMKARLQDVEEEEITKSRELGRVHKTPKRAILDAFREMRRRLQDYARKQRRDVKSKEPPLTLGEVVGLQPEEGFGFIRTRDGRQVYFHRDAVLGEHFNLVRIGSLVRFCEVAGEKGPQATTVKLVHPTKQAKVAADVVPVLPARAGGD